MFKLLNPEDPLKEPLELLQYSIVIEKCIGNGNWNLTISNTLLLTNREERKWFSW